MPVLISLFLFLFATSALADCPEGRTSIQVQSGSMNFKPCLEIKSASFTKLDLVGVVANDSFIQNTLFKEVIFRQNQFSNSELSLVDIEKVKARNSNFTGSRWQGGGIKESQILESEFAKSELKGVRWIRVDAANSSFRDSRWSQCYLEDVNLEDTDLRGAQFERCLFVNVKLHGALFNKATILPVSEAYRAEQGMVFKP